MSRFGSRRGLSRRILIISRPFRRARTSRSRATIRQPSMGIPAKAIPVGHRIRIRTSARGAVRASRGSRAGTSAWSCWTPPCRRVLLVSTQYFPAARLVDTLANKAPIDFVGYGVQFQAQSLETCLPQPPPFYRWTGPVSDCLRRPSWYREASVRATSSSDWR